jgi:Asparagine synthase (glutamine-hydrolyzing)
MVSKLARDYVTVILSGDGGDELFGGYTRYVVERKRGGFERLPKPLREGLMRPLSERLPHATWGRNYLHNVSLDPVARYLDSVSVFTSLNRKSLYTPDFLQKLGPVVTWVICFAGSPTRLRLTSRWTVSCTLTARLICQEIFSQRLIA